MADEMPMLTRRAALEDSCVGKEQNKLEELRKDWYTWIMRNEGDLL